MLTPFVLPHDDGAPSPPDLSFLNEPSAGVHGWIQPGGDGHLTLHGKRFRFWGVNVTLDSTIPEPSMAQAAAARLAKFGVNCVRFVDMDSGMGRGLLIDYSKKNSQSLNPLLLDRWHYFVAELKSRGIYSDICLFSTRRFLENDGLPRGLADVGELYQRIGSFFHPRLRELQKDYARLLLTTRNPHTGLAPIADPAVAVLEVAQDNGLIFEWTTRRLNHMPAILAGELKTRWNQWLLQEYGSTARLDESWHTLQEPVGTNMLANGDFSAGMNPWVLELTHPGKAIATVESDPLYQQVLRIQTTRPSHSNWHVQFYQPNIRLRKGQIYTIHFRVRGQHHVTLFVGLLMNHDPWENLATPRQILLSPEWQTIDYSFAATHDENDARFVCSGLALPYIFEFAQMSLRPGGNVGRSPGDTLEAGDIPMIGRESGENSETAPMLEDWVRFLHHLEGDYWRDMRGFLKEELKYPGLTTGTFTEAAPVTDMAQFDATSSRAYWQLPCFPTMPVEPDNWAVVNASLVNSPPGPIADLAVRRVIGKPHFVHEYGHVFPNSFNAEGPLLAAAYSAFQDLDGVWLYEYTLHARELNYVAGFYPIDQNPVMMANALIGAALFRMQLVSPFRTRRTRSLTSRLFDHLMSINSFIFWDMADLRALGLPMQDSLVHGVGIELVDGDLPPQAQDPIPDQEQAPGVFTGYTPGQRYARVSVIPTIKRFQTDTGEIFWDHSAADRGHVVIDTQRVCGVIGYVQDQTFHLQGMTLTPRGTQLDGWCTIMLAQIEGLGWKYAGSSILVATATMENAQMKWKSPARESVGREWGHAPTLIEPVPAEIQLTVPADRVMIWALDQCGQRHQQVPVEPAGAGCRFRIGPPYATLWYEIVTR